MTDGPSCSHPIAAVVLAGGDGTRLGLGAKALVMVGSQALIDRTLMSLRSQTNHIAINVRKAEAWADARGCPVVVDGVTEVGPLAGVLAAMTWAKGIANVAFVLTVPTDCPFLPGDLAVRLFAAMSEHVDIAVAASGGRTHHLIALWRTQLLDQLSSELQRQGPMPVHRFQARCRSVTVSWPVDTRDPFFNINTMDDLAQAEAMAR